MKLQGRFYLWVICLVLCVVIACKPNNADLPTAQPVNGNVAYLNLIPNGSAINFYVNGTRQNSNKIAYSEYSGYISAPSGEQSILFKTDSLRNNLFDPVTATLATDYTTIFVTGNSASSLIYTRDTATIDSKNYKPKFRFINASANSPAYDLAANSVLINNTAYKGISSFTRVDTGRVVINIKPVGASAAFLTDTLTLGSNKVYTFFIYGRYTTAGTGLHYGTIINK
jgi:hypothetical protein